MLIAKFNLQYISNYNKKVSLFYFTDRNKNRNSNAKYNGMEVQAIKNIQQIND